MSTFTFAPRPAEGKKGKEVIVSTNCFKLSIVRKLAFQHYHVIEALPNKREIKNKARRSEILKRLYIRERPDIFQPGQVVYDGKAGLYTSKNLGPGRNLHFELRESQSESRGATIRVELQRVGCISSSDFDNLLNQRNVADPALTAQQILNLLLYNAMPEKYRKVTTRNTMFDMKNRTSIGLGLLFVRGCFASVRLAREHLLLNVDVCSAIMYESNMLTDVALDLLHIRRGHGSGDARALETIDPARLLSVLKRVRVEQVKAGKTGRVRTIKEIVRNAGLQKFYLNDGPEITVQDYFYETYRYRLQFPRLPGIAVVKKDRNGENTEMKDIIPFELLKVVEGQFYRRKLDAATQRCALEYSTIKPDRRKQHIMQHLEAFNPEALSLAGLYFHQNPLFISGRLLPPPTIQFQDRRKTPEQGEWKMPRRDRPMFCKPCTIKHLAVLCYEPSCTKPPRAVSDLIRSLASFGINVSEFANGHETVVHRESAQGNKMKHLRDLMDEVATRAGKKNLKGDDLKDILVLVILPSGGKSAIYEEIKRIGDTTASAGLITQCLSWDMLESGKGDAYWSNVILKINAKMGGINFFPFAEGLEWIQSPKNNEPTMVIGLDVSHPGPGIFRPSMAAMVYSVDRFASRYFPLCSHQAPRVEGIVDLKAMISKALRRFNSEVKVVYGRCFFPHRLLVYRDGLSDGELANVSSVEIEAIKAGIQDAFEKAQETASVEEIKITYVVVGKRHHIRFFPGDREGDRSGNCPSGFVTDDRRITSPHVYDFFLQSHTGLLGTSRPAHYMVMRDENSLTADELQSITFGLCHAFARATRAVSVPAPVYYAHLVCKRASIHIRYKDDESAISTTGSSDLQYNEEDWVFYDINPLQSKLMYYA